MKELGLLVLAAALGAGRAAGEVPRAEFHAGARYLVVEVLDDDLLHFELSSKGAAPAGPLYTTPMVAKRDYPGPEVFRQAGNTLTTAELRLTVDPETLCVEAYDLARRVELARVCGEGLERPDKLLRLDPKGMRNAYGLGNYFYDTFTADGDWVGRRWPATGYGDVRRPFDGAAPSESQLPVLYALGDGLANFGFFFDNPYRQSWDFRNPASWTVETWGDQLRWYVLAGPDLPDLRTDYLELTGRSPIPPRSLFGLWLSKFGYFNWDDVRLDLDSLRQNGFPIDGFALDLQWFGGTFNDATNARMGSLWFDNRNFPGAEAGVRRLREDLGVELMLVEESYVDERLPEHDRLQPPQAPGCYLARTEEAGCVPVRLGDEKNPLWWGRGGMIDWTDPAAGDYWHDAKRHPLSLLGVTSHWLDLGEPEMFDPTAWYHGVEPGKNRHIDVHNLYNFEWAASIERGYRNPKNAEALEKALGLPAPPRWFSMSRAGAAGMQRLAGGMWSGDIGRNMGSLRAHLNTQMHMSLAGIDYYNSDVGGFIGTHGMGIEPQHTDAELYTQWFADSALGEIPLRPHGWAVSGEAPTFGPDRQGHRQSNLANLLQRYELAPYLYSLAHRAWRFGEPIFPPLVYHYQADPKARTIGGTKMIGEWLLFGVAAGFGQTELSVYLPKGRWSHYNTGEWIDSAGEDSPEFPLYLDRGPYPVPLEKPAGSSPAKSMFMNLPANGVVLTLPLFARAGAIIPVMPLDELTLNVSGRRADGSLKDELALKVFAGAGPTTFTLYEDDGRTLAYERGEVRETRLSQRPTADGVEVAVEPAVGSYAGAAEARPTEVELVPDGAEVVGVSLDGVELARCASASELAGAPSGCWLPTHRGTARARAPRLPVSSPKHFGFRTVPKVPTTSAHFVCDSATTQPGEVIYVLGSVPALGSWNPAAAVKLLDIRYPRWVARVDGLPPDTEIEWKCVKRAASGGPLLQAEPGPNHSFTTPSSGFAGTGKGLLK